ncbi:YoaK family protein [Gracilibacillus xinjiangensis]|uniref:YoaK family protein n=1 Tax=Gracilibacillus xinjiangensis TaxID=1193282 RepID=A0ABV8WW60_9BACI
MTKKYKIIPSLSSHSVYLAFLLTLVGGFLDAYTFISRDGVFANAQTANIVMLSVHIGSGEWRNSLIYIPPIIAFFLGVVVAELFKRSQLREWLYSYRRTILLLECVVLIIVGLLPTSIPNIIVTVCISFVSSVQISTFTYLDRWKYNSTMTTGNLRTAFQAAYSAVTEHDQEAKERSMKFLSIILAFLLGALIGTISTTYIGNRSVWIAVGILFVALILYHKDKGYFKKPVKERWRRIVR